MKRELITAGIILISLVSCKKMETDKTVTDLSSGGTANCYIVSSPGRYSFSADVNGKVACADVLWESFGNDVTPAAGEIVSDIKVEEGKIVFSSGKDGNAVIAARNSANEVLWSWHIWVCQGYDPDATAQVYSVSGVKMMDRNLGATSSKRGDARSLGLHYQWGRKDPFLTGRDASTSYQASSSVSWPKPVQSDKENGTIEFTIKNPMTFLTYNSGNYDWLYTGTWETDETRWQTEKTVYDPCPPGWQVPEGGENGIWAKALGEEPDLPEWDETNRGWNFGGALGTDKEIWYPAAGFRMSDDGSLTEVGDGGFYWSCTPGGYGAYYLNIYSNTFISTYDSYDIANCHSVRCAKVK